MNKQEALKRVEEQKKTIIELSSWAVYVYIVELIKSIDEPEKVKIPQDIAEYIEQKKDDDYHLLGAMIEIRSHKNKEIDEWFEEDDNMELFARAWLDGYEVEKEKLFKVRLKGTGQYLCNDGTGLHFQHGFKTDFTKDYLKKRNFGWVFDCEGIEIE